MVSFTHQTSRTTYTITLEQDADKTTISLQDKCAVEVWTGVFEPSYIEKLTAKAGYQLPYQRWGEILAAALSKNDLSCYVDVLTAQDLQRLRGKKRTST